MFFLYTHSFFFKFLIFYYRFRFVPFPIFSIFHTPLSRIIYIFHIFHFSLRFSIPSDFCVFYFLGFFRRGIRRWQRVMQHVWTRHLPSRWYYVENAGSSGGETHWTLGKAKAPESSRRQPSSAPSLTRNRRIRSAPSPLPSSRLFSTLRGCSPSLSLSFSFFNVCGIRRISWQSRESLVCVFPRFVSERSHHDLYESDTRGRNMLSIA